MPRLPFPDPRSLYFDGWSDYVQTAAPIALPAGSFTIAAWVNVQEFPNDPIHISTVAGIESPGNLALLRLGDAGNLGARRAQFAVNVGGATVRLNGTRNLDEFRWYHLAATYDGATMKLYLDGILHVQQAQAGAVSATGNFLLGSSFGGRHLDGLLDDVRVYGVALTAAQVLGLAQLALLPPGGPEAYWKLDEEVLGELAADSSGHSHDGTLGFTGTGGPDTTTAPAAYASQRSLGLFGRGVDAHTMNLSGTNFTIMAWVKPQAFAGASAHNISTIAGIEATLPGERGAALLRIGDIDKPNNHVQFVLDVGRRDGPEKLNGSLPLLADNWYHVAATYDGAEMRLYINGKLDAYEPESFPAIAEGRFLLGESFGGRYFNGFLDEVKVYRRALVPDEILLESIATSSHRGLAGYWKLDEADANPTSFRDSSGQGHHGTRGASIIPAAPAAPAPAFPMAGNLSRSFDGANDYINAGTINLSGSHLTISAWVKVNQFQNESPFISTIAGIEQAGGNIALLRLGDVEHPADRLQFVLSIDAGGGATTVKLNGNTSLVAGQWYHVAATYDGQAMRIYLNGKLEAVKAQTGNVVANGSFRLGRNSSGGYLDGTLDDVRVYRRALAEAEIASINSPVRVQLDPVVVDTRFGPADPVNTIRNPVGIVIEAMPTDSTVAVLKLSRRHGAAVAVNDARLVWSIKGVDFNGIAAGEPGFAGGVVGAAAFYAPGGVADNTGNRVRLYGLTEGRIRLELRWQPTGLLLETYDAYVVRERTVRYRVNLLRVPGGPGTTVAVADADNHIKMANIYLRQVGVRLVPDDNFVPTAVNAAYSGTPGIFTVNMRDRDDVQNVQRDHRYNALSVNNRGQVVQINYVHSIPGTSGLTIARPDNNSFANHVAATPFRLTADPGSRGTHSMSFSSSAEAPGNVNLWGLLLANHGDAQQYANVLAHELGHVVNLRHRTKNDSLTDDLVEPGGYNLMAGPPAEPFRINQDLDLIQLLAVRSGLSERQGAGALLPRVQFNIVSSTVFETGGTEQIDVLLTRPLPYPVTVEYYKAGGTAMAGTDYVLADGTLTFDPGDVMKTFEVTVNADALNEGSETVLIGLRNPDRADLGNWLVYTLTIKD